MAAVRRGIPRAAKFIGFGRSLIAVNDAPSLESLLIRVGNGSRSDFAALYDEVAAMVYGIALRVVRDPARAEDVAQDALIDVWRRAPSFDSDRGSAKGWIATIAHRRAVDVVRSEQASRDRTDKVAAREVSTPHDSVAAEIVSRAEREQVTQALLGLTSLQREVIELAYYQGYTYREVAAGLGAPLGTVKTRIRDGLKRLAEILEDPHA